MANNNNVLKSTTSAPRRYPAIEEKTTLTANLILVISLKLDIAEVIVIDELVLLKSNLIYGFECDCKDTFIKDISTM